MKTRFLFSQQYKSVGWFLLIVGILLGIILMLNDFEYPTIEMPVYPLIGEHDVFSKPPLEWSKNNIIDEIAAILIIIGGIFVSFSKTKDEDEYISKIRMESLIWATYVNYIVLFIAILFVFDLTFFNVMICNMFTILLFFIARFQFMLYKFKKSVTDEE
jgi:uncharacterized protein YacL